MVISSDSDEPDEGRQRKRQKANHSISNTQPSFPELKVEPKVEASLQPSPQPSPSLHTPETPRSTKHENRQTLGADSLLNGSKNSLPPLPRPAQNEFTNHHDAKPSPMGSDKFSRHTSQPNAPSTPFKDRLSKSVTVEIPASSSNSPAKSLTPASKLLSTFMGRPSSNDRNSKVEAKKNSSEGPVNHSLIDHAQDLLMAQLALNDEDDVVRPKGQKKLKKVDRSKIILESGTVTAPYDTLPGEIISPEVRVRALLDARFSPDSNPALTFSNTVNDRHIHGKFQFVDDYITRKVPLLQKKMDQAKAESAPFCQCFPSGNNLKSKAAYTLNNGLSLLTPEMLSEGSNREEIRECEICSCPPDCVNRVVQKGRTLPLEVFMTENRGFGIRSPQFIRKGQFIDVYLGELLNTKAIEDYENAISEKTSSYIFSLDFFEEPAQYHVQGLHYGSPARFINHSCNPNCRTYTYMIRHDDTKVYKIAYFAIQDIQPNHEILFDYSPNGANDSSGEGQTKDDDRVKCLCGEANCRGFLWPKRSEGKRKGRGWARS